MKRRLLLCLPIASLLLGLVGGSMARRVAMPSSVDASLERSVPGKIDLQDERSVTGSLSEQFRVLEEVHHSLSRSSVFQKLLEAEASELAALIEATHPFMSTENLHQSSFLKILAYSRLAELDAELAWTLALEERNLELAIRIVLSVMIENESGELIAGRISALQTGGAESGSMRDLVELVVHENPIKAIEVLKYLPKGISRDHYARSLFLVLAEQDANKAITMLDVIPDSWRREAVLGLLERVRENDPRAMMRVLGKLPVHELSDALWFLNPLEFSASYTRQIEDLMNGLPESDARSALIGDRFISKLERDPNEAVGWLNEMTTSIDPRLYSKLLEASHKYPRILADYFKEMPMDLISRAGLAHIINQWIDADKEAASDWMATLSADQREWIEPQLAYQTAREKKGRTFEERITALSKIDDSRKRFSAFENIAQSLKEDAQEKLDKMPAGSELREEFEMYLSFQKHRNVRERQNTLTEIESPRLRQKWTAWTADQMSRFPSDAIAWLGEQPESFYDQEAWVVDRIAQIWSREDPHATSHWIANLPESQGKDRAIVRLATETKAWDPEIALAWTASIGDPSLREWESARIVRTWARLDPLEAHRVLAEITGLSRNQRQRIADALGLSPEARP